MLDTNMSVVLSENAKILQKSTGTEADPDDDLISVTLVAFVICSKTRCNVATAGAAPRTKFTTLLATLLDARVIVTNSAPLQSSANPPTPLIVFPAMVPTT